MSFSKYLFLCGCFLYAPLSHANPDLIGLYDTTCRDLLLADGDERNNIILFHHGYISGTNKEKTADLEKLSNVSEQVLNQCIETPNQKLMAVFKSKTMATEATIR